MKLRHYFLIVRATIRERVCICMEIFPIQPRSIEDIRNRCRARPRGRSSPTSYVRVGTWVSLIDGDGGAEEGCEMPPPATHNGGI